MSGLFPKEETLERALLTRLNTGVHYVNSEVNLYSALSFFTKFLFDFLDPICSMMWKFNPFSDWELQAISIENDNCPKKGNFEKQILVQTVLQDRLTIYPINSELTSKTVCVPVGTKSSGTQVLTVCVHDTEYLYESSVEIFLESCAAMLTLNKDENGKHDSDLVPLNLLHKPLTARQQEILKLMHEGFTYEAIARRLGFSVSTIKQESTKIFLKLGVHSKAEALAEDISKALFGNSDNHLG